MKIEYIVGNEFLTARLYGEWTAFSAEQAISAIAVKLKETQRSKLLIDLTNFSTPSSDSTRFDSGTKMSEGLSGYKIAGFSQPEKINHLGEMSATNRGANFRMFDSETGAVDWLSKD